MSNEVFLIGKEWVNKSWKDILLFLVFVIGILFAYDGYEKRQDIQNLETKQLEVLKQNAQYLETMERLERVLLSNTEALNIYRKADAKNHEAVKNKINILLAIEKGEHKCQ